MTMLMETAVRKLGGAWPSNEPAETELYQFSNGQYAAGLAGGTARYIGTRTEFDATTARLRNEPSFDGAPDWAVAKAQDDDGEWYWYEGYAELRPDVWHGGRYKTSLASKGEVIGNWRDTLRLRPEEKRMEENSVRYSLFGNSLARRWARVKRLKEMAVEAERNRRANEVPSAPDNDWYKRGEFPPVGTVCRLRFLTTADIVATITYVGDGILCYRDDKGMEYAAARVSVELLPLKTEREQWIEKAKRHFAHDCDTEASLLSMYNDGLGRMPEEK